MGLWELMTHIASLVGIGLSDCQTTILFAPLRPEKREGVCNYWLTSVAKCCTWCVIHGDLGGQMVCDPSVVKRWAWCVIHGDLGCQMLSMEYDPRWPWWSNTGLGGIHGDLGGQMLSMVCDQRWPRWSNTGHGGAHGDLGGQMLDIVGSMVTSVVKYWTWWDHGDRYVLCRLSPIQVNRMYSQGGGACITMLLL